MRRTVLLRKATRIEGNANVRLEIEEGRVVTARLEVQDFRGLECFLAGRSLEAVPMLVSRICGLCSGSHQVAALRAIEDAVGAEVPAAVEALRDALVLGEWVASHSLSCFFLSLPDLTESGEGVLELARSHPGLAADALALRKAGLRVVELIGGRSVHPVSLGVARFLAPPGDEALAGISRLAGEIEERAVRLLSELEGLATRRAPLPFPPDQPVHLLAAEEGGDGPRLLARGRDGAVTERFTAAEFEDRVAELRADWTFAKFPYLRRHGFPGGIVLVGPLARLHRPGGVLDDPFVAALPAARAIAAPGAAGLDDSDTCRMLEIVWAARRIRALTAAVDPADLAGRADVGASGRGIGIVEAPRGLLVHGYTVAGGVLERMRLLVATQFNNPFLNLLLREVAGAHVAGDGLDAEGVRLVGRCVRLFDPCLSCATH